MKTAVATYRKKPVEIQAIQYDGSQACLMYIANTFPTCRLEAKSVDPPGPFKIITLEGDHTCSVGDYVIKGIAGEFYPCKPEIFEATYEAVE